MKQSQRQSMQNRIQNRNQNHNNNHNNCPPNQVIPEPAAVLAAALGLPALYFVIRRRKTSETANRE